MQLINPELERATLIQSPHYQIKETLRKIICDKYGIEGDCAIEEMLDEAAYSILAMQIAAD